MKRNLKKISTTIKNASPCKLYVYWLFIGLLAVLLLAVILWAVLISKPQHANRPGNPGIEIAAAEQPYEIMQRANKHFDKGMKKLNKKHYRKAISEFDKAIKINGNAYQYYLGRASASLAREHNKDAEQDLSQAIYLVTNSLSNEQLGNPETQRKLNTLADMLEARARIKSDEHRMNEANEDLESAKTLRQMASAGMQRPAQMVPVTINANGESKTFNVPAGAHLNLVPRNEGQMQHPMPAPKMEMQGQPQQIVAPQMQNAGQRTIPVTINTNGESRTYNIPEGGKIELR